MKSEKALKMCSKVENVWTHQIGNLNLMKIGRHVWGSTYSIQKTNGKVDCVLRLIKEKL